MLWKKILTLILAMFMTAGTATMLTGCDDDDDPIEEAADEVEEETD